MLRLHLASISLDFRAEIRTIVLRERHCSTKLLASTLLQLSSWLRRRILIPLLPTL